MPLAVVSWPSNMNVSTSARRSLSDKLLPFSIWERMARVQGLPLPLSFWAKPRASPTHTHSGKEEDVQEIQVPLPSDLLQLSVFLQKYLSLLDNSVCPRTVVHMQSEELCVPTNSEPP